MTVVWRPIATDHDKYVGHGWLFWFFYIHMPYGRNHDADVGHVSPYWLTFDVCEQNHWENIDKDVGYG